MQHYWAIHDTRISRNLKSFSTRLGALREREADYFDAASFYTDILNFMKDVKGSPTGTYHNSYGLLSVLLFACGTDYHDYAAMFAEQVIIPQGSTIEHTCYCDLCGVFDQVIRGPRFECLQCLDVDFCAGCYANWKKSNGELDFCKGHSFYEIPRPCWYEFKEDVVMEDGSTLPEVIDFLEERFAALLQDVGGQAVSQLVAKHHKQGDGQ